MNSVKPSNTKDRAHPPCLKTGGAGTSRAGSPQKVEGHCMSSHSPGHWPFPPAQRPPPSFLPILFSHSGHSSNIPSPLVPSLMLIPLPGAEALASNKYSPHPGLLTERSPLGKLRPGTGDAAVTETGKVSTLTARDL